MKKSENNSLDRSLELASWADISAHRSTRSKRGLTVYTKLKRLYASSPPKNESRRGFSTAWRSLGGLFKQNLKASDDL